MIYLNKGEVNTLALNIINNARPNYSGYTLTFTHAMSQDVKTYLIDTANPAQFNYNSRYCNVILDLSTDDMRYLGQYNLTIKGDDIDVVYINMAHLNGVEETNPFVSYVSPNEDNSNYVYIQD